MGPKRQRRPGGRQSSPQRKTAPGEGKTAPRASLATASTLQELFASLRTGAATVAGVSYQTAVSVLLLACGRAATVPGLPVCAVRPEGLEDIDCLLDDGSLLLVQAKDRGPGARAIAVAELADIIAHAAPALRFTTRPVATNRDGQGSEEQPVDPANAPPPPSRFAVVTDGRFGSSLPSTGWTVSLAEALAGVPEGENIRQSLLAAIGTRLEGLDLPKTFGSELLRRTHLVRAPSDLAAQTVQLLQTGLSLHPAVASIARAELLRDLGEMAARQREADLGSAERRTRSDLDAIVARLGQAVDVTSLEEAIHAGVCEPADYVSASPVDMAGFLYGVDVTPAHIAAGLDVLRPEESAAVLEGLATRRHAVIAGPSGSGKSALVWRTARLVERGPQIVRVLRVADADDVELLVRHVRRQMPNPDAPVLICADDLGRARMAAWPEARRRLSEVPGALILGAVRREDLTPDISADATIIDPRLTDTAAGQIYDAISTAGLPTILEREEALRQAGGLLMEFIALTTTGRRIRDVLATQVAALADPARRLQREALRLVCAAHTLGFAVAADALPAAVGAEPDQVGDALARLNGEHLLVRTGQAWQGLHDLRTELLLDLLHTAPPPTLSATYGRALALLPIAARAPAARRAAVRIARATAVDHAGLPPVERLASLQETLRPLAEALGQQLTDLAARSPTEGAAPAKYVAGILEVADRLDTIAYAHTVLPFLEEHRPPTLDVATLAFMTYGVAVDGLSYDIDGLQGMVQLARRLPARTSQCVQTIAGMLPTELVARLAAATDLPTAVRLCEAAEFFTALTAEQATAVYRAHAASLPEPPGSDEDIERADRRAQLTASLASLARLRGPAVAQTFGPPLPRIEDAVASDPYGCHVELAIQPAEPIPDAVSNLARTSTYDGEHMLVIRATAFARTDEAPPASAYQSQPGQDPASVHAQVVLLTRRIFDACPEADLVNAAIWQANRRPLWVLNHDEGVVGLRAGVLRRDRDTARSVAFQAAVAEALSAENWTTRLRSQAEVARHLVTLLAELPARLRPNDNERRRGEWIQRVEAAAGLVAALPGRPPERQAVLGTTQATMLASTAADLDQELRAKDAAKSALDLFARVLVQVARGLDDQAAKRGAGFRLADLPQQLRQARQQGAPTFAGIGDTLPPSLDTLATFGARLLTALGEPALDRVLRRGRVDQPAVDAALRGLAREVCEHDRRAVVGRLSAAGVTAEAVIRQDPDPMPAWQDQRTLALVGLDDWPTVVTTLQGWSEPDRETEGISGRVIVLPVAEGVLIPMGLHFFGAHGKVLLLPADDLPELSAAVNLPLRAGGTSAALAQPSAQLVRFSYEQVRRAGRTAAWHPVPVRAPAPDHTAEEVSAHFASVLAHLGNNDELEPPESYQAVAAQATLQLCELVTAETGADAGLAHQLADTDIAPLTTPEPGSAAYLFNLAHTAALEADRAAFHGAIANPPG